MRRLLSLFVVTGTLIGFTTFGITLTPDANSLKEKINDAISHHYHGYIDAEQPHRGHIDVEVSVDEKGSVILEGETSSLFDKYRVFNIVTRVPGVTKISNQMIVKTEPLPDDVIENRIMQNVKYNRSIIERDQIDVNADNGLVILSGKVSYNYEKELLQTIASWQEGVRSIDNQIEVKRPAEALSDENLQTILRDILANQFPTDKEEVTVAVNNGVATVNGQVDNLWSKKNIEHEFRDVIGILEVENYLEVESQSIPMQADKM